MRMKESMETLFMILAFFLFIGALIPSVRIGIASALDQILFPLRGISFPFVLLILAAATGIYTSLIQRTTVNWKMMKDAQRRVREFTKELREAMKTQNKYKIKKLEKEREEVMRLQAEMSRQQFRPMIYAMVVTLPIFFWLWWCLYAPSLPEGVTRADILNASALIKNSCPVEYLSSENVDEYLSKDCNVPDRQKFNLSVRFIASNCPSSIEDLDRNITSCLSFREEMPPIKLPLLGYRSLKHAVFGFFPYWIIWYLLCSIPVGQLCRKVLGM